MNNQKNILNKALIAHKSGNSQEAVKLYNDVLMVDPNNSMALYFLGILQLEADNTDIALKNLKKAADLNNQFIKDVANELFINNKFSEALEYYLKLVDLNLADIEVYTKIGDSLIKLNDLQNALKFYTAALDYNEKDYETAYKIGLIYFNTKEYNLAINYFNRTVSIKNDFKNAYFNLGQAFYISKNINDTISSYKKYIELDKNNADAYYNLAKAQVDKKEHAEAIKNLNSAITIKPDYPEAYVVLGIIYNEISEIDKSIYFYNMAISKNPHYALAYNNLGKVLTDNKSFEQALESFKKAVCLEPDNADYINNLGFAYQNNCEIDNAFDCYKKALKIKPQNAELNVNYASACLLTENFEEGWDKFRYRFNLVKNAPKLPNIPVPEWDGSSLKDKTIFICYEQGFGDNIQFARYLPVLNDMGARVLYKPKPQLTELFKYSDLSIEILNKDEDVNFSDIDFYCPIMSLPYHLNTRRENIPYKNKYLKTCNKKIESFKNNYYDNNKFKIGIFWQGNTQATKLDYFSPLFSLPDTEIYSLQKGAGLQQLEDFSFSDKLINLDFQLKDFSDTAAAIENMDLVITIDSAVAHLSGALGKKTYLLLTYNPEWRWLTEIKHSIWYDNIVLFRQDTHNSEKEVFNRVLNSISKFYNKHQKI